MSTRVSSSSSSRMKLWATPIASAVTRIGGGPAGMPRNCSRTPAMCGRSRMVVMCSRWYTSTFVSPPTLPSSSRSARRSSWFVTKATPTGLGCFDLAFSTSDVSLSVTSLMLCWPRGKYTAITHGSPSFWITASAPPSLPPSGCAGSMLSNPSSSRMSAAIRSDGAWPIVHSSNRCQVSSNRLTFISCPCGSL